jgi:hypothetical protein
MSGMHDGNRREKLMTDDQAEEEALTPEERASRAEWDRKAAEVDEHIQTLIDTGYALDGVKWVHPTDKEIWYIFDPLSHETIFSPKRAQQIEEEIDRQRRSGQP